MKTNISALMGMISEVDQVITNKMDWVKRTAFNTTIEELNGRVNVIEDNKENFTENLKDLEDNIKEISRLKCILYEKNNSFKLSDGRSIQEAIVDNTNLRKIKTTYEYLLGLKNSKRRITEVNNSYFESMAINYDVNDIRKKLKDIDEEIQKTDFEISKLNSKEFEI